MSTFSDNFDGGSGNLDARAGWGTTQDANINAAASTAITLASNVAQRSISDGEYKYVLADTFTPGSADYFVSVDCKAAAEAASNYIYGPLVRGSVGATGASGYTVNISPMDDLATIMKWTNGTETAVNTFFAVTSKDWSVFHTVKLNVSGGATTTIQLYIDGNLESTQTDSTSPITAAGNGGLMSYYHTQALSWDNFLIDDLIANVAVAANYSRFPKPAMRQPITAGRLL